MIKLPRSQLDLIIRTSKLTEFTGDIKALGGGEINDTYVLGCGAKKVALRIAKYPGGNTLSNEAAALGILNLKQVPKLVFFDPNERIEGRQWILEEYIDGKSVSRLSINQFKSLGSLLALIHRTKSIDTSEVNIWSDFLDNTKRFGDEQTLLHHPDKRLRQLISRSHDYFLTQQPLMSNVQKVLLHKDATPSNILTRGEEVCLIDWEFSKYGDPMTEFSSFYYEDIETNQGKWHTKIKTEEKKALFDGYRQNGGVVDAERLELWMNHDKLGCATFLYWRLYQSDRPASAAQINQYKIDLENLITSLENSYHD